MKTTIVAILLLIGTSAPALAHHTPPPEGTFQYCLDHGGTRAQCKCERQPLSC
jgi:hypothetical protein